MFSRHKTRKGFKTPLALFVVALMVMATFGFAASANATDGAAADPATTSSDTAPAPAPEADKTQETTPPASDPAAKETETSPPVVTDPAPKQEEASSPASKPAPAKVEAPAPHPKAAKQVKQDVVADQFDDVVFTSNGTCTFTAVSPAGNPSLIVVYNDFQRDGQQDQFTIVGGQTVVTTPSFKPLGGYVYDPRFYDPETGDGYFQDFYLDVDPNNCVTPPPACVEANTNTLAYSYSRNTLTVSLKDKKASLCDNFTFSVARWAFDMNSMFPQTFADKGVKTLKANKPGASATATVIDGCGQFDAYANKGPKSGDTLTGPNSPYHEVFINTKASGNDTPYTVDDPSSCVTPPPVVVINPSASVEAKCDGTATATLNNTKSTTQVGLEVVVNGVPKLYSVEAGKSLDVPVSGAKPGSVVSVQDDTGTLASATVPDSCDVVVVPPKDKPKTPKPVTPVTSSNGLTTAPHAGIGGSTSNFSDFELPLGALALVALVGAAFVWRRRDGAL